jgi:hypothetical protein
MAHNEDEVSRANMMATIDALQCRIAALERKSNLRAVVARKYWLVPSFIAVAMVCGVAAAQLHIVKNMSLLQFMDFSTPAVTPPPLDTSVRWQRRDPVNTPLGNTNQILSLIADANQRNSYTWPLYIQLSGTTDPNADIHTSQSVGSTVRAFNRSTGSPSVIGHHTEIYHGMTAIPALGGHQVEANGTSVMFNGELTTNSNHGRTVGLNLQNTPASTAPGTDAINIQSTSPSAIWQNGVHFESPGAPIAGNIGINFDAAHYNMGIDLAENSLRLNAGQKIYLEKFSQVFIWYNPATARIELMKSGQLVAAW